MCEEIKKNWDEADVLAVRAWYESQKSFDQVEKETNLPSGTLYNLVNAIQDYKGTRRSIGGWLRRMCPDMETNGHKKLKTARKRTMKKNSLPKSDKEQNKIERQLQKELDEARKKIARLEAQQAKDLLRRDFLEGQLEEYRKLVKPSQSKKSNTK